MAKENRRLTSECNGETKGFESEKLYEILVRDKLLRLETFRAENKNDGCKIHMNDGAEEKGKSFTDPENLKPCFLCYVRRMVRKWRSLERIMSAGVKGFAVGGGVEGVLLLLGILIKLKKQRLSSSSKG
ncbi:hypothetical protein SUGI_0173020 [Cryptomeria japonica]|nr:hypothetical protein SUGI_0173020 [Cryptomeria japonica]